MAIVGTVAACGGSADSGSPAAATTEPASEIRAELAGYDLAAGRDQRVIFGLLSDAENLRLVSFGSAAVRFTHLENPGASPQGTIQARWIPAPGQKLATIPDAPRLVRPTEGAGVYLVESMRFPEPGKWRASLSVVIDGAARTADADFVVGDKPLVIKPGDRAPRTESLLPGDKSAPAKAVDSRAQEDGSVPDASLHRMTVADAVTSGRPTMIVVSTPVFCLSQFCGPITDFVGNLESRYGERMNFVHLEVWRDYAATVANKAAGEWIFPTQTGSLTEPWVFLVDADGVVAQRWDNVVEETELESAVQAATA
ncbi:MAG: hypothetical protein ACT4QF_04565 [Sporichthyaceae bacterium]